jgi:hypothetical protein
VCNFSFIVDNAEALAYRLDLDVYGIKCGYFSDVESCRPSTACVVDMYIDDKANLPWNTETRFDTYYGRKSKELLWSQNKNDKPEYLKYRTIWCWHSLLLVIILMILW